MTQCYVELAGSPEESWGPDGMKATRSLVVPWANRDALVLELLGNGFEFSPTGKAEFPLRSHLKAVSCTSKPFIQSPDKLGDFDDIGGGEELNSYGFAELRVEYEMFEPPDSSDDLPEIDDDTFLKWSVDYGGEFMEVPGHSLEWRSDDTIPVSEDAKPTIRIPIIEHHLSWSHVITPPWASMRGLIGRINDGTFLGVPEEQMLFAGIKASKEFINPDQLQVPQYSWKIDYLFKQRSINALNDGFVAGWNHTYRGLPAGGGGWDRLRDKSTKAPLYQSGDFNPLFDIAVTG